MAHFAKLGANGKVIQVLTLDNKDMKNADGVEDEGVGQQYLEQHNNWPAQMWIQTSYNTYNNKHWTVTVNSEGAEIRTESSDQSKALRGNYAGIGFTYDEDEDIFWPPKPFASWVKNLTTASWESPVGDAPALSAEQQDTHRYDWNESNQSWDLTERAPNG